MADFRADRVHVEVSTSGTADFVVGAAVSSAHQSFAAASVPDAAEVYYTAYTTTQFECGKGVYDVPTTTVVRTAGDIYAGTAGAGAKTNFSAPPRLFLGPLAESPVTDANGAIYSNIPQNSQSTAYTLVLSDAGKHILHPSADTTARTFTIPANASIPFAVGTAITFVNQNGAGVVTIAINSDVMRLAGAGTSGSRTLAANGVATAVKITATEWIISGTGLT